MNDSPHGCDLLIVSPHTDDAEIALGGTCALLADRGRSVWLLDLTRGELGSNGTPDDRWREAAAASEILGIAGRLQAALPDGFIGVHDAGQVAAVTHVIRRLRPRWLATAPMANRHPDHRAIGELVTKAAFMSRLAAYRPDRPDRPDEPELRAWPEGVSLPGTAERWEPEAVLHPCRPGETPDVLFDVSAVWERKLAALRAYVTQFEAADDRRRTMINDPLFLAEVERWARGWGFKAGASHAEALRTTAAPVLDDLPAERWS